MHQQPQSSYTALAVDAGQPAGSEPEQLPIEAEPSVTQQHPHHVPRWLERMELFVRVMLRMYIGIFICYAPWSHSLWDQNPLILHYGMVANFAVHGAVRGMVSGLGLLNLWIAFRDAARRRNG